MKSILVVTDFSEAAHSATLYCAALAKAFNAKLFYSVPLSDFRFHMLKHGHNFSRRYEDYNLKQEV